MKYYRYISFYFICSLILCCNSNPNHDSRVLFKKEIPTYEGSSLFADLKDTRDSLKLDTLENGFDSLEIRLWFSYANSLNQQVLVIRNKKGLWDGEYWEYLPQVDQMRTRVLYIESSVKKINPNHGWIRLIDKLMENDILTLPDYQIIKDYSISTGGYQVAVEVSNQTNYRLYCYPSLLINPNNKFAKKMINIVQTLNTEFNLLLPKQK